MVDYVGLAAIQGEYGLMTRPQGYKLTLYSITYNMQHVLIAVDSIINVINCFI